MERFIAAFDLHRGYEREEGKKRPLHDDRAWQAVLAFASDFKPHHFVLGGDVLDCGAISHHNARKPGKTEGLKLLHDVEETRREVILPIESVVIRPHRGRPTLRYHIGNHEDWLQDLVDTDPALEGLVNVERLLGLDAKWDVVDQGRVSQLGKLAVMHGDTLRNTDNVAKAAVSNYETNIIFGHFHTSQTYTKTSALDAELPKTGTAVGCLCTKDPGYNERSPNRWAQGFAYGYLFSNGDFTLYTPVVINGRFAAEGKEYRG
jgi:hypothetical protein